MDTFLIFFVIIIGLCFGSFANVIIYRIPIHKSVIKPHSSCIYCNKELLWYCNIPILSYIFLLGRCRWCKKKISIQYPLVELLMGILFFFVYTQFKYSVLTSVLFLILVFILIVISFIDFYHKIIPDIFSVGLLAAGIVLSPYNIFLGDNKLYNIVHAGVGSVVGGGILLIIAVISEKILKKETMGGGDIKLLAGIGACIGWKGVLYSLFTASLIGSVVGYLLILFKRTEKNDPIPFGPFLSIGALITIFMYKILQNLTAF